ncbi:MAG: hypothetical protein KAW12_23435 [Candidatus Aminicenantes bacterium]|nr:hypothetical protein [Candidatus Aminicenantes bacterium]
MSEQDIPKSGRRPQPMRGQGNTSPTTSTEKSVSSANFNEVLVKKVLAFFEKSAPVIVKESVDSLSTNKPIIDLYDGDFYLEKAAGAFAAIDKETLETIINEHIDEIDAIFLECFKEAKIKRPAPGTDS